MDLAELKLKIKAEEVRAYKLKTRRAKEKAWQRIRELRTAALMSLYAAQNQYATQSIKAIVLFGSESDEHVLVSTVFGNMWISPTTDENSKSWYASTCCIEYAKGQELVLEIETDVNSGGLFLQPIPERSRGGTLNEIKYMELCKKGNLAFFKYPDGHMSGLFAKGAV